MSSTTVYRFLELRPETDARRLFVKGRDFAADILYGQTVGEDARTPQEVAEGYRLPVDAVVEAIEYSEANLDLIHEERARELAKLRERDKKYPPLMPPDYRPT
jgi:hypothetical protein